MKKKLFLFAFLFILLSTFKIHSAQAQVTTIDTAAISELIKKGDSLEVIEPWNAIDSYIKAIAMVDTFFLTDNPSTNPFNSETFLLYAQCLLGYGKCRIDLGDYPGAINLYQKAYGIYSKSQNKKFDYKAKEGKVNTLLGFALIQLHNDNTEMAKEYALQAQLISKQIADEFLLARSFLMMGNIYHSKHFEGIGSPALDTAIIFYQQAAAKFKKIDKEEYYINSLINIGGCYHDYNGQHLDKAAFYYKNAIKELETYIKKNPNSMRGKIYYSSLYRCMGNLSKDNGNLIESEAWLKKGLELAIESRSKQEILITSHCLRSIYNANLKYQDAYNTLLLYTIMKDSIYNEKNASKIRELEAKFQSSLKDKEILKQKEKLAKEQIARYSLIGGLLLFIIISVLAIRSYKIKKRDNRIIAAEKKRSDDLLLNILPSETAEELKQYGHSKARSYDLVTVLFTDFKDFTKISETMTAENLVMEIDHYFREFDRIIGKYSIEKIKTIGDSYMCAGGLPAKNITHALDVVKAAIEMTHFMKNYQEEKRNLNQVFFEIRIGIHTGPVVAGIVGVKKFAYDIWGDTVNTASRMESSGEPGRINISESTYELVKNYCHCSYRGKVQAKNKGLIDMYFVDGLISD